MAFVQLPFSSRSPDLFCRFTIVYEGHSVLCCKEKLEPLDRVMEILRGHRSAWFPLWSACRLVEFDTSIICHLLGLLGICFPIRLRKTGYQCWQCSFVFFQSTDQKFWGITRRWIDLFLWTFYQPSQGEKEVFKIWKPTRHYVSDRAHVAKAPLPVMPYKDMPYYIRLKR